MKSLRDRVRPLVHIAWRLRDRSLHSFRRRRSRQSVEGKAIQHILVLCHGNICRSPFLAVALAKHLAVSGRKEIQIRSAGFLQEGRPTPDHGQAVARQMGFDLSQHRSVQVTSGDLQTSDLIVVMSDAQATEVRWRGAPAHVPVVILGDWDPFPIDGRTIIDPWKCDESVFRSSYERIDRCAGELARTIASNRL